jgi:pyrimidine operon attenuation protein / uracil phosphoribosyltransferase
MSIVMRGPDIGRSIARMAHAIAESNGGVDGLCIVGVHTGGVAVAKLISVLIGRVEGVAVPYGEIDITLYRDDLYTGLEKPVLGDTRLPFELKGKTLVLVDDVLFTGRTVRACLDEIMDYGRPAKVQLAVLVDRGHRELPIAADFVGRTILTEKSDKVDVFINLESPSDSWVSVNGEGERE